MNIIDERDVRTVYRKLKKKEYDDILTLSTKKDETYRLLDEGMVVNGRGNPDFYIMKGTLQKYYDALPDDYEGHIDLGHMDFATFPILLGKWTKKDLSLVDIGSGRKGLDVKLRLDEDSLIVKELRRVDYDLGISAEFSYERDEKATDEYGLLMVNEIFIRGFAIVGDAGNVNSGGIQLKEGEDMDFKKVLSLIKDGDDLSKLNDLLDQALAEEKELDATEEPEEETEETEEPEEETEEEAEETEETEKSEEQLSLAEIAEAIKDLKIEIESLKTEKEQLQAQLNAKEQAETAFLEKFKKLNVSLSTERKEPEVVQKASFTDGFGG